MDEVTTAIDILGWTIRVGAYRRGEFEVRLVISYEGELQPEDETPGGSHRQWLQTFSTGEIDSETESLDLSLDWALACPNIDVDVVDPLGEFLDGGGMFDPDEGHGVQEAFFGFATSPESVLVALSLTIGKRESTVSLDLAVHPAIAGPASIWEDDPDEE